jgi:hypothetical protein
MHIARRGLLPAACAAVAGLLGPRWLAAPARAQVPTQPAETAQTQGIPRVRLPLKEFAADDRRVASLRRGVQAMRRRAPSQPLSWFFQGAVHAVNDTLLADAILADPDVAAVDRDRFWNKCPHFGQDSADFLIWHRAYLYYFERILRDAAQDADLALPYWNYADPDERAFPAIFAPQFYGEPAHPVPNPLYHPNREVAFTSGRYALAAEVAEYRHTREAGAFFGGDDSFGFAGVIGANSTDSPGLIERRPHNDIHLAVGGVVGAANGAMADVPTAAFDPVFWVHHANVDRIWVEWSCAPGKGWGRLPERAWLDARPWHFHDFDLAIKNEPRAHYIDPRNLDLRFKSDDPQARPLELPTAVVAAAPLAGSVPPLAVARVASRQVSVARGVSVSAERGARSLVARDALRGVLAGNGRVFLVLRGISYARVPSTGFAVHVDPAGADGLDATAPSYVGAIALFGIGQAGSHAEHGPAGAHASTQSFDITTRLAGAQAAARSIEIRIVPYDLLQPVQGAPPVRRPDAVMIAELQLVAG